MTAPVMVNAEDVIRVLAAHSSPDDWNVPSIYVSIAANYIAALAAGADPDALIAHGGHMGRDCCEADRILSLTDDPAYHRLGDDD